MSVIGVNQGTAVSAINATTLVLHPAGNIQSRSWGVITLAYGIGATDFFSTLTDSLGNVWTQRISESLTNGGVSIHLRVFTSDLTAGIPTTATAITATFSSGVVFKTMTLVEASASATDNRFVAAGSNSAIGATTAPTITTASVETGELAIGIGGLYHSVFFTGWVADPDWPAGQTAIASVGFDVVEAIAQCQTAVADGALVFDPDVGAFGVWALGWLIIGSEVGFIAIDRSMRIRLPRNESTSFKVHSGSTRIRLPRNESTSFKIPRGSMRWQL